MPRDDRTATVDAERRLRLALGRQPTAKEIADLRLAEQALGLEKEAFLKARQLMAMAQKLHDRSAKLMAKLQEACEQSLGTVRKSRHLMRNHVGNRSR